MRDQPSTGRFQARRGAQDRGRSAAKFGPDPVGIFVGPADPGEQLRHATVALLDMIKECSHGLRPAQMAGKGASRRLSTYVREVIRRFTTPSTRSELAA